MKQTLQLKLSQHLTLTPQLQQSIRLLQLSTLELSQEVDQMLDDNPFLELNAEEAVREEFGREVKDLRILVPGAGGGRRAAAVPAVPARRGSLPSAAADRHGPARRPPAPQ